MFLPAEYAWFEPVLVAAGVVFVVGLIGNLISFGSRFGNALVTAIVFAVIFGALTFVAQNEGQSIPAFWLTGEYAWLEPILIASAVVFVVDLIGNIISFSSRFLNAIVTAVVFAVIFGALTYAAKEQGQPIPTLTEPIPPGLTPGTEPAPTPSP